MILKFINEKIKHVFHQLVGANMIKIVDEFFNKKVRLTDIDNNVFEGIVVDIRGKEDNEDTGRDSLNIFDGKDWIFFSDNEIKTIEFID